MCYAIPAKILSIDGENAEVDYGGILKTVNLSLLDGAKIGDYVLIHTGFAIEILKAEGAEAALASIREHIRLTEGNDV